MAQEKIMSMFSSRGLGGLVPSGTINNGNNNVQNKPIEENQYQNTGSSFYTQASSGSDKSSSSSSSGSYSSSSSQDQTSNQNYQSSSAKT